MSAVFSTLPHLHTPQSLLSLEDVYVSPELRSVHGLHCDVLADSGISLAFILGSRTVLTHCFYQGDFLGAQSL